MSEFHFVHWFVCLTMWLFLQRVFLSGESHGSVSFEIWIDWEVFCHQFLVPLGQNFLHMLSSSHTYSVSKGRVTHVLKLPWHISVSLLTLLAFNTECDSTVSAEKKHVFYIESLIFQFVITHPMFPPKSSPAAP